MSQELPDTSEQAEAQATLSKLVPVGESIKYRRRAQQAEVRIQEIEQQLADSQSQLEQRSEEVASAEAQRDELQQRIVEMENRHAAERLLGQAGVADLETATLLLAKRVRLDEDLEPEALRLHVEQLMLDKPFLNQGPAEPITSLPPKSASPRPTRTSAATQLAQAAQRAIHSGNRRDIAEYLRLRRQTATQ